MTNLGIQEQTNSSITLSWKAPLGPGHPPYTYWVSWIEEGSFVFRTHNTTDNNITLKELEAGSMYTFIVQAERNRVISDKGSLTGATAETQSSSGPAQLGWGRTVMGDVGSFLGDELCSVTLSSLVRPLAYRGRPFGLLCRGRLSSATKSFQFWGLFLGIKRAPDCPAPPLRTESGTR